MHTPDFLQSSGLKVRKRKYWPIVLIVVLFLLLGSGAILVRPIDGIINALGYISESKRAIDLVEVAGSALDFSSASASLDVALLNLTKAETELEKSRLLIRLPWAGVQIEAIQSAVGASIEAVGAIQEILNFGSDIVGTVREAETAQLALSPGLSPEATLASISREQKRMILARFVADVPILESARDKIERAMDRINEIPEEGVAGTLLRAMSPLTERLPKLRDDIQSAIILAKVLPSFAGYPNQKDTLILFLNNAELRPGGGFVGTVGRMTVADATILSLETKDSYAIDRPAEAFLNEIPPAPLARYFGLPRWFMRDANWSPDFRVSAEQIINFYERETNRGAIVNEINNVIGFTPTFASEILRITGPVLVREETFTPENLFELLEYQVERGFVEQGIPQEQRKEILSELVESTVLKLLSLPLSRQEEILSVLRNGFRQKQIMVYDRDSEIQQIIETEDWSGAINNYDDDFFMVVDANLGSLKSDPFVKRRIDYKIELDGSGYKATVSITYRHEGHFDWKTTRYRTYTRLFVPANSEFISASGMLRDDKLHNPRLEPGDVDVIEEVELGRLGVRLKSFGAFISIEPGEERTLSFTYRLGASTVEQIRNSCYKLRAQKQLGASNHALTLDLDFDKTIRNATPAEDLRDFGDDRYRLRTNLAEDRDFEICF